MKNNPTRSLILNAARKHFYQRGYNNTSIRMIASELNMSNVNLFNYFKNKRELLAALFGDFFDSMFFPLNQLRGGKDHPIETILIGIETFQYMISYNKRFADLYEEALDEDIIINITVKNLYDVYKHIGIEYSLPRIHNNELIYTIYALHESMMSINTRASKKELSFPGDFLREHHIKLFYCLFHLNQDEFCNEEKRAFEISKKYDYHSVSDYWTKEWIEYDLLN